MTPLRKRMIDEMQLQNCAPNTILAYIDNVARFARYFKKSPDLLGRKEVRIYLLYLRQERKNSVGTYKLALAALRFFYREVIKRPEVVADMRGPRSERRLPVVLSFEEVRRFFAAVVSFKYRMIFIVLEIKFAKEIEPDFHLLRIEIHEQQTWKFIGTVTQASSRRHVDPQGA